MKSPTSYAESGSAGGSNVSFKEAFRAARKQGLDTFTWRGKKYTTELKEEKPAVASEDVKAGPKGPSARRGTRGEKEDNLSLPSDRATGFRSQVAETGMSPEERRDVMRNVAVGAVSMLPAARAAKSAVNVGRAGGVNVRGMTMAEREREAAAAAEYAKRMKRMKETAEARSRMGRGAAYKKGGVVKSSASRRADGCAMKGKTRGKMI